MQISCSGITCHGSVGQPAKYNTDFFNPPSGKTIEQVLIGKAANYTLVADPSACPSDHPELLVNPTTPSESLILKKIKGTQSCGVRMPNAKSTLSQDQIACFVDWVNAMTGKTDSNGGSGGTGGTGGATAAGDTSRIPPTFDTVKTILTENVTSCVGSDCHGGHPARLNLQVNDGLLGRLTSSDSKLCGMPIVDPGRPNNSAIVKVLREGCGTVTPNCLVGTACIPRMPIGCTEGFDCISEEYIKAIEQWITDGAKP
ncbi:MAG TPA: hypothetical protein VIV60_27935 [Polyangiaceae bacterium]